MLSRPGPYFHHNSESVRVPTLLFCLAVARVAAADDREDARTEFAAGQQSDKDKDYATAIGTFRSCTCIRTRKSWW